MIDELTNISRKILIVGAHPDDAEFSTGRLLLKRKGKNSVVLCLTDGRKGQESTQGPKIDEEKYAIIRIAESKKALKELNVNNMHFLGIPDQKLIFNPYIIDKIYLIIKKTAPDYILIPPYEGAHPDHDTAHLFTIIAARNYGFNKNNIIEYGSYNNYNGKFRVQEFIPADTKEYNLIPTPNEQKRWLSILKIFKTQKNQQLHYIPRSSFENYRRLPSYDYRKLPYTGKQALIIRHLLLYPIARKILPNKDKLFYETWKDNLNPIKIKQKLNNYIEQYGIK